MEREAHSGFGLIKANASQCIAFGASELGGHGNGALPWQLFSNSYLLGHEHAELRLSIRLSKDEDAGLKGM